MRRIVGLKGDGRNWGERKADAFKEFFRGSKSKPKPRVSVQVRFVIPAGRECGKSYLSKPTRFTPKRRGQRRGDERS